ncbi:hypothetical protein WR25_13543 [Diploscapter pachys]|uniref:Nematode cuticle collagen N-terminal domain-containing protein n=1 Tax=Diploscapter pachys TaxID=2018661 RepID=A0A2A2JCK5_9BILA|nr:hypothetical protein WR25_13543 [Diploscapter pachys]
MPGISMPGPPGEVGDPGEIGPCGLTGHIGHPGKSAWRIVSPPGTKGRPGLRGRIGMIGVKGEEGTPGEEGLEGPEGDRGNPGRSGEPGKMGEKGYQGVPGIDSEYCRCPERSFQYSVPDKDNSYEAAYNGMPEIQQQGGDKVIPKLEMNFEYTAEPTATEVYTTDTTPPPIFINEFDEEYKPITPIVPESTEPSTKLIMDFELTPGPPSEVQEPVPAKLKMNFEYTPEPPITPYNPNVQAPSTKLIMDFFENTVAQPTDNSLFGELTAESDKNYEDEMDISNNDNILATLKKYQKIAANNARHLQFVHPFNRKNDEKPNYQNHNQG